ncbi:MAG: regulatory protein RecX [Canibacter sp.]
MVVRFIPDETPPKQHREDREDLAEIIELRSLLGKPEQGTTASRDHERSDRNDLHERSVEEARTVLSLAEHKTVQANEHARTEAVTTHAGTRDIPLEEREAYTEGIRILARKQLSAAELRRELLHRDNDPQDVEEVVFEFIDRLYLDDEGLARTLSESLREKKQASRAEIARKLHQRFIDRAVVDAVVAEIDMESEYSLLDEAAQKRSRRLLGLDRETAERRLLGFLARRGWQGEAARNAARAALDEAGIGSRGSVRFR